MDKIGFLPEHLKPAVEKARNAYWSAVDSNASPMPAAILAFLSACLQDGTAREAGACEPRSGVFLASTSWTERRGQDHFPALILSLAERKP